MTSIPLDPSLLKIKSTAQPVESVSTPANPVPPTPSSNSGWIQTLLIIGAIVLGFVWLSLRDQGSVGPVPPIPANAAEIAERSIHDYAAALADAEVALADAVDSKKIDSAEKLQSNSQAFTKAARVKAFEAIDKLDNETIPAGIWAGEQFSSVSAYLRKLADGHRKAAK